MGVDGFIPASQLSPGKIKNLSFCFPIDSNLKLKVVEFDKDNKKIVLSALGAVKDLSDDEINAYINEYKLEKVTADRIKQAELGKFDSSDFNMYDSEPPVVQEKPEVKKEKAPAAKAEVKKEETPVEEPEVKVETKSEESAEESETESK